jgi:hypothetical protein
MESPYCRNKDALMEEHEEQEANQSFIAKQSTNYSLARNFHPNTNQTLISLRPIPSLDSTITIPTTTLNSFI